MGRVIDPVARVLLAARIPPDAVTIAGTAGVLAGAVVFAAHGHLVAGTVVITLCALTDLVDGSMARQLGRSGGFGAFLDSTMDRVADGAIFAAVAYWLGTQDRQPAAVAALICLVAGQIVSYAKARAQSLGRAADVGVAERAERLILLGVGGLVAGFGWPYGLDVALWLLAVLSVITVGQRIGTVYRQERAATGPRPGR
jgi:CDP-diacylglycerol--glycerol-3-phosphate 3-phosphatidyltransferase